VSGRFAFVISPTARSGTITLTTLLTPRFIQTLIVHASIQRVASRESRVLSDVGEDVVHAVRNRRPRTIQKVRPSLLDPIDTSKTCRRLISLGALVVERHARRDWCYVFRGVLTQCLTSEFRARKNLAAMITVTRKPLDTCVATGCYRPSWSHSLLGEFQPRVNMTEF
jgi:hypothetical protein